MTVAEALIAESLESSTMTLWHWHLHDEVGVVGYGHELGEHRSSEDSVVRRAKVRDVECQVFCAEILLCAKGDQ
jgi:hypothetical protein